MKTRLNHILSSGLFTTLLLLLFLGLSYPVFGQSPVIITDPGITTWDVPTGVTSVTVECWGAGGSGGSSGNNAAGGGGGGGAYSRSLNIVVVPNTTVEIQVGAGPLQTPKNASGSAGGNTWFLTTGTVNAEGGAGGVSSAQGGTGGAGGLAANGIGNDTTLSGGTGTNGAGVQGGTGGAGANGGAGGTGGNNANGNPGSPPGGGGGGSGGRNNLGAAGANGQIVITYTVSNDPTITLGTFPAVCEGETSANLPYSATTNSPDQYSIDYVDDSFTDIVNATLNTPPNNIPITIPGGTIPGVYNATLTVTNSGTSATSGPYPFTVTVNSLPNLIISDPAAVCPPATVDLTAAAVTAGSDAGTLTYWTDAGATITLATPAAVTTSGTYYIKLTDGNGCETIQPVTVTINPLPNLIISDPAAVCSPATVDLTAAAVTAGSDAGTLTYWTDAGATITLATPAAVTTSGTYYIKLTDGNGCESIQPVTVTINPLPNLIISDPAAVCSPATVDLTAAVVTAGSDAGTLTYWTDAGATSTLATPAAVTTSGTYYIKLTDGNGCETIQPVTVTINPLPNLIISDPAAVCSPATVDLTAAAVTAGSDAGTLTYWTDAGATITLATPAAVTTSGTYYIKLTDGNGCETIEPVVVTINPLPNLIISDPAAVCSPATVDLTAAAVTAGSDAGTLTYWTDAGATSTLATPAAVTTSGTYYIKLTDGNGCETIEPVTIIVNDVPALPVISGPTTVTPDTPGLTYNVTAVPGATDYVWTVPGNPGQWVITAGQGTEEITVTSGTKSGDDITVYITNACGDSETASLTVTIGAGPECPTSTDISNPNPQTVCEDVAISQLSANINGAGSYTPLYQWYYNTTTNTNEPNHADANLIAGATLASYTPLSTVSEIGTRYYFCVGYATDAGCTQTNDDISLASTPVIITVNATPLAPTGTATQLFCAEDSPTVANLTATGTAIQWYDASTGGSLLAGSTPLTNGNYYASQTVGGCESTSRLAVTVTLNDPPSTAILMVNQNISVASTTLEANSPTIGTGVWSITSGPSTNLSQFSSTGDNTATFTPAGGVGDYVLRWTISNAPCTDSWSEVTITSTYVPSSPPTITLTDPNPLVVQGGNSTNLIYIATTNSPDQYSINYDATAEGELFVDVTDAPLPVSPIALSVPPAASLGTYNGILTVKNTSTGLTSGDYPITITVTNTTDHSLYNCTSCHITHTAPGTSLTTVAGNALLCQSCHISTGAASAKPLVDGIKATPGVGGNSHSWDVSATNTTYETVAPAPTTAMGKRLPDGNIICSTCHNQHSNDVGSPYLRIDNTGDAMCKVCHTARDVGIYTDAPATHKGSHPVGINYTYVDGSKLNLSPTNTQLIGGKVECSSCHGVHDVDGSVGLTTDGNLLRTPNTADAALCKDCHIDMTHNGMNCLDCHQVHNTDKSNLYMIKSTITTPSSGDKDVVFTSLTGANNFADGDGIDGVCEVCHTTTSHFRNSDNLTGVPDQLHTSQGIDIKDQNCTTCHEHGNSFAGGGGSCLTCHSSVKDPVNRLGAPQIVGTGGEFDPVLTSRHTPGGNDPTDIDCANCHTSAGTHSTDAMELKDVDDEIEPFTVFSGDLDVYCVKCHDASPPTGITFPGSEYNKASFIGTPHDYSLNSCMQCHNRHGSSNANLLAQASNLEVCNACHTSGGDSTINIDTWTSGGNSHAWNANATNATFDALPPLTSPMDTRLEGTNIICSTCHDPHSNTNGKFLVNANTSDQMCKDCHRARDIQRYQDDVANKGSHPVGVVYSGTGSVKATPTGSVQTVGGNVECSSCHQPHNAATSDGTLLRQANDVTLCTDCHTYGTHNTMNCLDCHEVHNTGSNNLYLIKEQITVTTPAPASASIDASVVFTSRGTDAGGPLLNSFADGNGTYNGICEVCHTDNTNNYHYNTSAGDHTHEVGRTCTDCHTHETNFAKPNCHSCHDSSSPFRYPLASEGYEPGSHQIHVEQYEFTCNTCHFGHGSGGADEPSHSSGTKDVVFNPAGLAAANSYTPTWDTNNKTCSNVYCHSNTVDVGPTTTAWGGASLNCVDCHGVDISASESPGTAAHTKHVGTLYNYACSTCHNGLDNTSPGHVDGTKDVVFDPAGLAAAHGANPTWTSPTCSSVYCHSNGKGAHRGTDGTFTWSDVTDGSLIPTYTDPDWTGSITACTSCHYGAGDMTGAKMTEASGGYSFPVAGWPGGGHDVGAHESNSQRDGLKNAAWVQVQCFWCHNTETPTSSGYNDQYQGTYGTSFHVDGQTLFLPNSVTNGGTMVDEIESAGYTFNQGHCASSRTCFN